MNGRLTPLKWENEQLVLLDQRLLPREFKYQMIEDVEQCHKAIKDMVVRGAPLIGFTALWGMVLWMKRHPGGRLEDFIQAGSFLKSARPTAVNLEFEVEESISLAKIHHSENGTLNGFYPRLKMFAEKKMNDALLTNSKMARFAGDRLVSLYGERPLRLMTLCNTGVLACGPVGTALGVITRHAERGLVEKVWVSETRPYMQGTRLTALELSESGIAHQIVVEGAASYLMKNKLVDAVFVGADRIAANGDTANKIGTSTLSIVCKNYNVPFFVVAPTSTFDLNIQSGEEIDIELRDPEEITRLKGLVLAPEGSSALNPSFDVTDRSNISGIICERGIIDPVCRERVSHVLA